ncbi:hypothetical protein CEUSTIGMA_g12494.t1 [Chlamydomonas eustigma]|uniref:Nuclear cap-binding protein subunit 2 n=1 Tax=Chlamydomonas eustigma TaxID=1157962 RepID=A0A250XPR2_9CHLO|nr:hypothetical protein CEUSTIGMA_g12494.t1 [Chlamydomonas eustigma]|eukprot:GAX85074.1 hypothetical protein CEUSTIGMA_g12494.t1 [Chlamydomonas eustigma]
MSRLLKRLNPEISAYKDMRFEGDQADWERALRQSTTVYVGNLSFCTREEQIYEVFSKVGHIDKVIMGLDKNNKTPCGFCFVIYYSRRESEQCVKYLNGTVLDDRIIRVDHDWGFVEGRQWGRGRNGGQVRDEFRQDYDPQRGGWGKVKEQEYFRSQALGLDDDMTSPMPRQGDSKRRRMGSIGGLTYKAQTTLPEEENPRLRGRRESDDDDE